MGKMDKKVRREASAIILQIQQDRKILKQVMVQTKGRFFGRHIPHKVYSLHEPEVVCIKKGKRGKPAEYGCKVNLCFDKNGYVVAHQVRPARYISPI
jgi:IS5 family transposase